MVASPESAEVVASQQKAESFPDASPCHEEYQNGQALVE